MASKFGLNHSQTQFFSCPNKTDLMSREDDDDSWEVRAFEEDTRGNALGCTWPPRSYSCTFCRREFRSAQALGGHMNVHRRDRARLHDAPPPSSAAALLIPTVASSSKGLCLVYPLLNPSSILFPSPPIDYSFPLLPPNDTEANSVCHSEASASNSIDNTRGKYFGTEEELDLELRLGRRHDGGT